MSIAVFVTCHPCTEIARTHGSAESTSWLLRSVAGGPLQNHRAWLSSSWMRNTWKGFPLLCYSELDLCSQKTQIQTLIQLVTKWMTFRMFLICVHLHVSVWILVAPGVVGRLKTASYSTWDMAIIPNNCCYFWWYCLYCISIIWMGIVGML